MFPFCTRAVPTQYFWLAYLLDCSSVSGELVSIWDDLSSNSSSPGALGETCVGNDAWILSSLDPGVEADSQPALHLAQLQAQFKLKRKVQASRVPHASPEKTRPRDKGIHNVAQGDALFFIGRAASRKRAPPLVPMRKEVTVNGRLSPADLRIIYLSAGFFWVLLLMLFCSFADTGEWVTQNMAPSAQEAIASSSEPELVSLQRKFRWLLLLFSSTLVLLLFEIILAASAHSVTLLADSAHTGADVVGYGLNLLVEWLRIAAKTTLDDKKARSAAQIAKSVDVWGTVVSLAVLIFATCFAVMQAFRRLHQPTPCSAWSIGLSLLFFAVISTVMNVGVLCVYQWWHNEDARAEFQASQTVQEPAQTREADGSDVEAYCIPVVPRIDSSQRQNLPAQQQGRPGPSVNMFTATLHLVLDAIRSVLILMLAFLIIFRKIHDVVYADAISGFIVAGLVAVGSTTMLVRACQLGRSRASG